ncbi:MAG: thioesterase [Ignavibacteriaceae bacterium]|nr:thioesterase [Ignavibacteriaceae bacterium]
MNINPIWEITTKVRAFDADANDRLKVNTILDYFQDAASNDAERLNFGYSNFVPRGLTWVLSWAKFEFIKYPKFIDEVKIQTWGKKQYKLYSIRDYLMFDSKDEIICRGTSAWLLLDSKSLRPKILPQLFPEIKMHDSIEALIDLPQKITHESPPDSIYSTQIRYSDIDLNQHANNAKYIELMLDCFNKEFHSEHTIKSLVVSFNAESKYGDEIQLFKGIEKEIPLTHYIEAKNQTSNKIVFQAIVEWN